MLSKLKKLVKGEQMQAAYEIENADVIHQIEYEAFKQEQKRRSSERRKMDAEMRDQAEQKAIESAKKRGVKKATPIEERIEDNFDEALEKAIAGAKKVKDNAIVGAKKAQDFIESPGVQKKFSNARHNLGNVGGDLQKIANPPREPVRGRRKQVVQRVQVVGKAVVREHPVHARKEKPRVGNPNKGNFGVREDEFRTKPIIGNPNRGFFGKQTSSQAREKPTIGNRNRGLAGLKPAGGDRDRSLFGRDRDVRFNVR